MKSLLIDLCAIVGRAHLLTGDRATKSYRRGFRSGGGPALAVVRPGTLVEMWRILQRLVRDDIAIIIQAANTGLTGGSAPDERIMRPVVIINVMRLDTIHVVDRGQHAISLPGATLAGLERKLAAFGREPHSVIGSTCFGASVVGGICNNSGGALIRRGPAYTEMALFAQVDDRGALHLVNRLGVDLGEEPETMLARLEQGDFAALPTDRPASATHYEERVRAIDAPGAARFNADPACLHDASGSAGRIAIFAVRTESFERSAETAIFHLASDDPAVLTNLRRAMLASPQPLPISAEYIHRDAMDVADRYGRDVYYVIRLLGTGRLPLLFSVKAALDRLGEAFGIIGSADRTFHWLGRCLPPQLSRRARKWQRRYTHHLLLKVDRADAKSTREQVERALSAAPGEVVECTPAEGARLMLHRFVVASAAVRYLALRGTHFAGLVSLDVALPRNLLDWHGAGEEAPEGAVAASLVYGHFFCHVFHRDYLIAPGFDPAEVKAAVLMSLDRAEARYPAEHNVGREYRADPVLERFYRKLDPTNRFNPGLGGTATGSGWADDIISGDGL